MDYAATEYDRFTTSISRSYNRPAGASPYRRDVSPQFVGGLRNDYYTNPTFQSSVFNANEDRRRYQDRSRSARRQDQTYQDAADNRSQADARSVRPDENLDRQSRKSHTPVRTPQNEPSREARRSHTPVQESVTPRNELQYKTNGCTDDNGHTHLIAQKDEGRTYQAQSKSPVRASPLQQERQIEDIERHLHVTHHQESAQLARRPGSVEREPSNFYNGYSSRRQEVPVTDVFGHTTGRADIHDDLFAAEKELKQDFQKKLDEYHRYLDETKDALRSKSQIKRYEAEIAKQHAALLAEEKRLEKLKQKENQIRYKEMLDHQQNVKYDLTRVEREIATHGDRLNKNSVQSQEGSGQQASSGNIQSRRERPVMKQLGRDLQEAMQFRKKLDQMTREGRADEFFKNQGLYNNVEKELKERTKIRQVRGTEEQRKQASDYANTQVEAQAREKEIDQQLVRNLQEHDENMIRLEKEKKKIMQQELKNTLVEQIKHKESTFIPSPKKSRPAPEPVEDDGFGTNEGRGHKNFNLKPDLELNRTWKQESATKTKVTDRELIQALSEFDAMKINEEKQRKREMALQLNQILKEQMKLNDQR